jgi:two-component system, LytTR family, sensor kinase
VHEVQLRRELEFLDCYLRIQQTRFQDRLSVHFEIDPETLNAAVPHLILQPLVENAIRHGISPRLAPGSIAVSAQTAEGWLELQIVDDGVGMPAAGVEGVGLRNTRARLRQLYEHNFEFSCENVRAGGCRVTIRIPFRCENHPL